MDRTVAKGSQEPLNLRIHQAGQRVLGVEGEVFRLRPIDGILVVGPSRGAFSRWRWFGLTGWLVATLANVGNPVAGEERLAAAPTDPASRNGSPLKPVSFGGGGPRLFG